MHKKLRKLCKAYTEKNEITQKALAKKVGYAASVVSDLLNGHRVLGKSHVLIFIQRGIFKAADIIGPDHAWWADAERAERIYSTEQLAKKGIDVREIDKSIRCGGK